MNKTLLEVLRWQAQRILAGYFSTQHVNHPVVKGSAREALFRSAIEPWFGPSVAMGSGHIISYDASEGDQPPQCDVVLYFPDVQAPIHLAGARSDAYFPVEGVAAVVEVKSNLATSREAEHALTHLGRLDKVVGNLRTGAPIGLDGKRAPSNPMNAVRVLFAFGSSLASSNQLEAVLRASTSWDLVCILGLGTWIRSNSASFYRIDHSSFTTS